jgi:tripartite-type tricarboxylate transporter receptor subunit TctC
MTTIMRAVSLGAGMIGLLASAMMTSLASAQSFPDHPIRVVIPYAPGGGTDIIFRTIAPEAGARLGQTIVVDNRPGGSSIIGTSLVSRAPADGYTLLATDSAILINPGLFKDKLTFDTQASLTAVTMMATSPALLVVFPKVPAKTLDELIALAKSKPGTLNYASGGVGAATHLAGELMNLAAGIEIKHIPYKGTGPALTAVLSGEVDMGFLGISSARQYVESGALRAIALTGHERNPSMPDVPTFADSKLNVDGNSYWGIYAPAGVPKPIIDQLNAAFAEALHTPEIQKRLAELGYIPIANSPEDATAQMHAMIAQWTSVVDKAKIQME